MSSFLVFATLLVVLAATAAQAPPDEDFAFDASDDFEVEIESGSRKFWNNKKFTAYAGQVFHLVIPKEAFGGNVKSYEARRVSGAPLPFWLLFDKIGGVFWGVPLKEDVGALPLVVRAHESDRNVSDEVTIDVLATPDFKTADKCPATEDRTVLTLLLDKGVRAIKPKQRVIAVNNIAKFFGLPYSAFSLEPQLEKDDITDSSVVLAGPGNLHSRSSKLTSLLVVPVGCDGRLWLQTASVVHQLKQQARDGTISEVIGLPLIGWRVKTQSKQALRSKRQINDYGSGDYEDYYDNYDDEDYEEDDMQPSTKPTVSVNTTTSTTQVPTHPHRHHHGEVLSPEEIDPSISVARGHHQDSSPSLESETLPSTVATVPETTPQTSSTSTTSTTTTTTTTTTTEREKVETVIPNNTKRVETSTHKNEIVPDPNYEYEDYEDYDDVEDDDEEDPVESKTIVPEFGKPKLTIPEVTTATESLTTSTAKATTKEHIAETTPPITSTDRETTIIIDDVEFTTVLYPEAVDNTVPSTTTTTTTQSISTTSTTTTTTPTPTTTTAATSTVPTLTTTERLTTIEAEEEEEEEYEEDLSTTKLTTVRHTVTSPRTTTAREITEGLEYEEKNFQPYIENRLKQMSVIAGKIFRFVVPNNTFNDFEDGHNLTLEFLNAKGEPLSKDSWCHFNPFRREIYGLPLEEDVSKWEYVLKATDREGASVTDVFTIQVQQHKLQRVVNHEISLYMKIEKKQEFAHFVDWCLKTLRALGRIYNTNMSEITVRNVNYTSEPVVFVWTNDSIPTNYCPVDEIDKLFRMLTANDRGDPRQELSLLLGPELRVKKVSKHGLGVCETPQVPVTPPTNFSPFLRNPVDHINATVGELLVFKVPDDTFYDPEDTDSRTLNISLLTADRQTLKPNSWLQFDNKNREFYGVPKKPGRSEYQLVCTDSGGSTATDSLEIVVYPSPKIRYNVEFSMTVETPYDTFANSASMQRKFIEKLQDIFGDRNASYIHLPPFKQKDHSTIVTWHNKSLNTIKCPHDEISHLESMLKNHHDRGISSRVSNIMEPEFPISKISVSTSGICRARVMPLPPIHEDTVIPVDEKSPEASSNDYQYLMTFTVPVVIILIMLCLAAVAACVLYRRRRTGKMNVEEDGRQSYGNKGIPVIFQEELEEKPESGTKTPVILKDEKPPLAPPEYSKSGSLKLTDDSEPYQPPPPFTRTQDNGRQPRPKPTPTYRKPPPYVPP